MIEVRRMGTIEVWRGRRLVRVDGYSVVEDGRPTFPWVQKREANRQARDLRARKAKP